MNHQGCRAFADRVLGNALKSKGVNERTSASVGFPGKQGIESHKPKRTRKRKPAKLKGRTLAQEAMRAIWVNRVEQRRRRQLNGKRVKPTPEQAREADGLLAEVRGPVMAVADRLGWEHIPARDRE